MPSQRNRKVQIPYDVWSYKGRHLVENVFADIKEFRGIATRYHKLVVTFCAGLHLVSWHLRARGRKPRSSKYLESKFRSCDSLVPDMEPGMGGVFS